MTALIVLFSANMPPPGANVIKLFMSIIYSFSYEARVLVRIGSKSLPGTNTLAY